MKKKFGLSILFFLSFLLMSSREVFADITTGNATSQTIIDNVINTNGYDCDCDQTPTPTETPTPTQTPPPPGNGGGGGGGSTNPPVCSDQKPGSGPFNLHAVAGPGSGQVTLSWEPAKDPVNGYNIAYSDDPNVQKYGVPNVGNVTSYTISGLSTTMYYFWVMPLNGCMPGDPIGPVTVGGTGGPIKAVLGLSTTGSDTNGFIKFLQIFAAFALSTTGFAFYKKNA